MSIQLSRLSTATATIAILLLLLPAPVLAQSFFPIPDQLSAGIGVVGDSQPRQRAPAVTFSLAFVDSGSDYWTSRLGWVLIEAELGSRSDLESCQTPVAESADSPHCVDAAALTGLRFTSFIGSRGAGRCLSSTCWWGRI